ncbi:hypothetical protein O6H91_05G072100 [Diphasiastrum complanatum]|uniref:Uncharacterized protein n=1 Tax=Diphasiastrum complanatum TaxID=34168 RepID=A0ACC2DPE6_DIPCM|nr:hypothetical protein O6H91_05G072100 [Diphasiastrum complanatum]
MVASRKLQVWNLGFVKYPQALALQNLLVSKRRGNAIADTLLSLQHPPTFTLGKRRTAHNILVSPTELQTLGAEVHFAERGGDVTFHGPGQAVLYPILDLRQMGLGARRYVEGLEDCMIKVAEKYGVHARGRLEKLTGVWVEDRKIGAVGVRISSGSISSHGLAFNIKPDLRFFSHIVPCGIRDKEVTSLEKESCFTPVIEEAVTKQLIEVFAEVFGFVDIVSKTDPELLSSVGIVSKP